jgi:hypothetical protein
MRETQSSQAQYSCPKLYGEIETGMDTVEGALHYPPARFDALMEFLEGEQLDVYVDRKLIDALGLDGERKRSAY